MANKLPMTALILAGGKSSRMGQDKALLPFPARLRSGSATFSGGGDRTMLENIVEQVVPIFVETFVVVNSKVKVEGLDLKEVKVYEDFMKHQGPLGGIYTGLCHSRCQASCVFTCDMPFINESFIRGLVHFWKEDLDAVCIENAEGALEPFPGIYARSCRFLIRSLLDSGEHSMRRFLQVALIKPVVLREEKIDVFTNMNTIEDYDRVLGMKDEG